MHVISNYNRLFFLQPIGHFFSTRVFFHGYWRCIGLQGKEGNHLYSSLTVPPHTRIFRHFFVTLHLRWLPSIFNIACTQWDLPTLGICIWLIINWIIFLILMDAFTLDLLTVICHRPVMDLRSHRLLPQYYKQSD